MFDLHEDTVILVDEPGAIEEASRAFLDSALESLESPGRDSLEALSVHYFMDDWDERLARHPRLELEQLGLTREDSEARTIQTQSTTRFHGDVPAFMEEARKRVAAQDSPQRYLRPARGDGIITGYCQRLNVFRAAVAKLWPRWKGPTHCPGFSGANAPRLHAVAASRLRVGVGDSAVSASDERISLAQVVAIRRAVALLFDKAAATGVIPPANSGLFLGE